MTLRIMRWGRITFRTYSGGIYTYRVKHWGWGWGHQVCHQVFATNCIYVSVETNLFDWLQSAFNCPRHRLGDQGGNIGPPTAEVASRWSATSNIVPRRRGSPVLE